MSDDDEAEPGFAFLGELQDPVPGGYWVELIERIHRRELGFELAEATALHVTLAVPAFTEALHAILWAMTLREHPND